MSRTLYEHQHYFGFEPLSVPHLPDCPAPAVEASMYEDRNFDHEVKETRIRVVCFGCGRVVIYSFDGEASTEHTDTAAIGYGSKPEKVHGLYLFPGLPVWRGHEGGPTRFYVSRSSKRPASLDDVVGMVAWWTGPRGGTRWGAGIGCEKYGMTKQPAAGHFASRRAAVAWIAQQLAGEVDPRIEQLRAGQNLDDSEVPL